MEPDPILTALSKLKQLFAGIDDKNQLVSA
jgi:hypothetical protein